MITPQQNKTTETLTKHGWIFHGNEGYFCREIKPQNGLYPVGVSQKFYLTYAKGLWTCRTFSQYVKTVSARSENYTIAIKEAQKKYILELSAELLKQKRKAKLINEIIGILNQKINDLEILKEALI